MYYIFSQLTTGTLAGVWGAGDSAVCEKTTYYVWVLYAAREKFEGVCNALSFQTSNVHDSAHLRKSEVGQKKVQI